MAAFPLVDVAVIVGSQEFVGEALPDTGYDGWVIIPTEVGAEILQDAERTRLRLADGSRVWAETWEGHLLIDNQTFETEVHSLGDKFILGLEVLNQMEICFEFGERVRVRFDRE